MELWTRRQGERWTRWADPVRGLACLLDRDVASLLVECEGSGPYSEPDEVMAALRVARSLDMHTALLAAARHPSSAWAVRAREAGAGRLLLADGDEPSAFEELALPVCPALHARDDGGVALSVCGRHGDRLVLAADHLRRWCLGHNGSCPHWRPEADGSR